MTTTQRKIAERPHQIVERVAEFIKEGDLEGVVSMFHFPSGINPSVTWLEAI